MTPDFQVVPEMQTLRTYLSEHDISWTDTSVTDLGIERDWMCKTYFEIGSIYYVVFNGAQSIGGYSRHEANKGLLEMLNGHIEGPIGDLTAENVITQIEKDIEKQK